MDKHETVNYDLCKRSSGFPGIIPRITEVHAKGTFSVNVQLQTVSSSLPSSPSPSDQKTCTGKTKFRKKIQKTYNQLARKFKTVWHAALPLITLVTAPPLKQSFHKVLPMKWNQMANLKSLEESQSKFKVGWKERNALMMYGQRSEQKELNPSARMGGARPGEDITSPVCMAHSWCLHPGTDLASLPRWSDLQSKSGAVVGLPRYLGHP